MKLSFAWLQLCFVPYGIGMILVLVGCDYDGTCTYIQLYYDFLLGTGDTWSVSRSRCTVMLPYEFWMTFHRPVVGTVLRFGHVLSMLLMVPC